ncbi:tRNA(fMet)-specific endonuclease VapC [termite gut metagenome]|uniref:tRNA(fMet)-specific endonuclease VapC n=1 Tax=termite gut metagenome TaxID=433724 RepID=A0A5J4R4E3_9ZZZZ
MEQSVYLIDTNAVIDYLEKRLPAIGMDFMGLVTGAVPTISIITKIELFGFKASAEHHRLLTGFMNDVFVLELTNDIVEKCIDIRKRHKIDLPDVIIAATALARNSVLISRNVSDFRKIQGLQVIDPHRL